MNRRVSGDDIRRLLDHIRARVDGVALRTAFIVGFPGETEKQFEQLHAFVEEQHFDHLGVFTYSPEPGTAAGKLVDDVPAAVKQQRFDVLMQTQQQISDARLAQRHGQMVEVMLDGYQTFGDEEEACELLTGHTQGQALDIDGCVIVEEDAGDDKTFEPGQRVMVRITDHTPYDLIGRCGRSVPLRCGASVAEHEDSGRSVPLRCDANEIPERDAPGTMQNPERDAPGTMGLKGEDV
jgi:ribosomal protein S12 methylthiotransferase